MLTYADVCRQSVLLQKRERQEGTAGRGMRACGPACGGERQEGTAGSGMRVCGGVARDGGGGDGGGRVCGFWHIMTLASDWAEQAREAMRAFETLSAARCAGVC
jgi:hypothetical protein